MPLKVTTEPLADRQLALLIEVDQERVDQELRKAARKAAAEHRIPGFRKGKAPYSLVAQYVGLPALYQEFLESLGEEVYRAALEQEEIEPYAMASLDVESLQPLTYRLTVPLDPRVELGDYRSLRVEEDDLAIDDAEIDAQLEQIREEYADWQHVDRPSQYGDLMTIDVRSVIEQEGDGEPTVVLDEVDWEVTPDQENPMEPPGFDEALLGLEPEQETDFVLEWPADGQSIHAGKRARFSVKVKEIQAYDKPEIDDDFAQLVGPDFATVEELKQSIRNGLLEQRRARAESDYAERAIDALVEQAKFEYPPVVVEDQLDVLMSELERQLRQYGIEDMEDYFRSGGQTADEYRESLREQAEVTARRSLVISELYKLEGITVDEADVDARITAMIGEEEAGGNNALANLMREGPGRAVLASQMLRDAAVTRLVAIARGEELPALAAEALAGEAAVDPGQAAEAEAEASAAAEAAVAAPTPDADSAAAA